MAINFAELKKNRASSMDRLNEALSKINTKKSYKDDTYWTLSVDDEGVGQAIIRFLDTPEGEEFPFVRYIDYGFKGPGGWYINKSRVTINDKDPVAELNSKLWRMSEDDKSPQRMQARRQGRRINYVSNILIVKDPAHPENNGKVFRYKYGQKIFEKLNALAYPEFEGEPSINPFDLWTGANFKLRRKIGSNKIPTYDDSKFEDPSPIASNDEEIKEIYEKCHSLNAVIAPDQFKSYEELETQLRRVLGDDIMEDAGPTLRSESSSKQKAASSKWEDDELSSDDEVMNSFKSLVDGIDD